MELANFIASYILSVLTLIGLVVAIMFYFHQNKILNSKSEIDHFYSLVNFLDKNSFTNALRLTFANFDKIREESSDIIDYKIKIYNEFTKDYVSLTYQLISISLHAYRHSMNQRLFDDFMGYNLCLLWKYIEPIKSMPQTLANVFRTELLQNYIIQHPEIYKTIEKAYYSKDSKKY